jgi:exodeoxyribonuclease VII large subunit
VSPRSPSGEAVLQVDEDTGEIVSTQSDVRSIADLYGEIEMALAAVFPRSRELWVRGEVQSFSDRTGHCYLNLVDPESAGERNAPVLKVKCWRNSWAQVKGSLAREGIELTPGMVVVLRGAVDFYRPRAEVGFIMAELDITALLGRLAQERAALIRALGSEGLLERNKLLAVPAVPLRVGLVASPGTEGYRDFLSQLDASGFSFTVLVAPAVVQGADAPASIAAAISKVGGAGCDVAVVVRGGVSKADLAAFDTEPVARAIATAPLPVWTGIGHTGDESVADLVANRSCITPTECGRTLAQVVATWWERQVATHAAAVVRRADEVVAAALSRDRALRARLTGVARQQLRTGSAHLARRGAGIARRSPAAVAVAQAHAGALASRVAPAARAHLDRHLERASARRRLLAAYDVERQLQRGYTLTLDPNGTVVRGVAALAAGSEIVTRFSDGTARSRVEATEPASRRPRVPPDPQEI